MTHYIAISQALWVNEADVSKKRNRIFWNLIDPVKNVFTGILEMSLKLLACV